MKWAGYSLQPEEVGQRLVEGECKGDRSLRLILVQSFFPPSQDAVTAASVATLVYAPPPHSYNPLLYLN